MIGKLRHRVEIQELQTLSDGQGGTTGAWVKLTDAWAFVEPKSGSRGYENESVINRSSYRLTMRSPVTLRLSGQYRIIFDSRVFVIQSFINRDERNFTYVAEATELEDSPAATPIPDATAIVQTVSGEELARKDIASGATATIIVPDCDDAKVLHTYPYHLLNTGQIDSFAVGDDPWVRENVFEPEIATWPTDRPWVFPVLVDLETLKDNNIFGNKNRFTDLNGDLFTSDLNNSVAYDHYSGLMYGDKGDNNVYTWSEAITEANDLTLGSFNDWHLPNNREGYGLSIYRAGAPLLVRSIIAQSSTTNKQNGSTRYRFDYRTNQQINILGQSDNKVNTARLAIFCRKAFTYDPITEKMILA